MSTLKTPTGFSLLEVSLVLFVLALLMHFSFSPLTRSAQHSQTLKTRAQLQNVQEALIGFVLLHGRLPCPDYDTDNTSTAYGLEDSNCNFSFNQEGYLPWKTLGVEANDPFGDRWRYRIERKYADALELKQRLLNEEGCSTPCAAPFPDDKLQIIDSQGRSLHSQQERPIALVFSLGKNQTADGANAVWDAQYQADAPSHNFDDELIWINRSTLAKTLLQAGKL